jgi:hypothetical protein
VKRVAGVADESIGVAWLEQDGTLVLHLSTHDERAGGMVHATFRYPKDHAKYAEILAHVGPLAPGEKKPVKPWG